MAKVSPLLMPPIGEIVSRLVTGLAGGELLSQLWRSLLVITLAGGSGVGVACILAVIGRVSPWVDELIEIAGALLHPLPGVALLPIVVLWVGVGTPAVAVIIVHSVVWPVVTNMQTALRTLPTTWRLIGANYRLSPLRFVFLVIVPGTFPYLLAGCRIAWARSWRALISAEMVFGALAGGGGLGWFLYSRRVFMDTTGMFAGIILVMGVGSAIERGVFTALERWTIRRWGMVR